MNTQKTQQESGTELFARLLSQKITQTDRQTHNDPKLTQLENILMINKVLNIDSKIFPNGINNKEIIDINGKIGLGKSELVMHLIARCLLPVKWGIDFNKTGNNTSLMSQTENLIHSKIEINLSEYSCLDRNQIPRVILIETDSKFNFLRLYTILENRILICVEKYCLNFESCRSRFQSNQFQSLLKRFIRECLKNLTVYRCYNSEQFILALSACELFIQSLIANDTIKTVITPIFIDSINSNFEIFDKYNHGIGIGEYDHTEKYTVQLVKKMVDRYNVCFVATRPDFSIVSNGYISYKKWLASINKQLEIKQDVQIVEKNDLNDDNDINFVDIIPKVKKYYLKLIQIEKNDQSKESSSRVVCEKKNFSIENHGFCVE